MKSAKDYLTQAERSRWALPHFNFANAETLRAIIESAAKLKSPVFVATSEGERKFIGPLQARSLVDAFKKEFSIPIFLNADHTKNFALAKEAIDVGYDAVLIDASALAFEENIALTEKVVNYVRKRNKNIIVEGELGYLRGESKIQEFVEIKEEDLTKPKMAKEFIAKTSVDLLAPAVGNIHGIVTQAKETLRIPLIKAIKEVVGPIGLVLHGASGLKDEDVRSAIASGISVVHINTELRVAFTEGLKSALDKDPREVVPYKYLTRAQEAVKRVVEAKIKLCGSMNHI